MKAINPVTSVMGFFVLFETTY